jgi:hypothetical protein
MDESYNKTYNHYEIDVVKRADCVTISCLDKQLHKSYQETFTIDIVSNVYNIGNLNNFIKIIAKVFENDMITIIPEHNKLNFDINYNEEFAFKFNFSLVQVEETQLNANSIYIKKLEERIDVMKAENDVMKRQISKLENSRLVNIGTVHCNTGGQVFKAPIYIPLRINELIIDTQSCRDKWNKTRCCEIIYDNSTLSLTMVPCNDNLYIVSYDFFQLKPKKVTFIGRYLLNIDKTDFPCECLDY